MGADSPRISADTGKEPGICYARVDTFAVYTKNVQSNERRQGTDCAGVRGL